MDKVCKKCGFSKDVSEFHRQKTGKYGVRSVCKECRSISSREKYPEGYKRCLHCKELKLTSYFGKCVGTRDELHVLCKACKCSYDKRYNKVNHERIAKKRKERYYRSRESNCAYTKEWRRNNKDARNRYERDRRNSDLEYRLLCNMRTRLCNALKRGTKSAGTVKLVGCSISELVVHLESLFTKKMSWDNYGDYWNIDHIKPCASFNLEDEFEQKACFNYINLRPFPAIDNSRKGAKFTSKK